MTGNVRDFMDERRGISLAAIDTIYNYYLSTYGHSSVNRYDTHKKSELRSVYNNIVKINKESPLYKLTDMERDDTQQFAIDVKESARNLAKTTASLSSPDKPLDGAFKKKVAASSNEDAISVSYIGSPDESTDLTTSFELEVKKLASSQINQGNFVSPDIRSIEPERYTFDYKNNDTTYEFQYTVFESDTNESIFDKIKRLVNTAGVGVQADIIKDEQQNIALKFSSTETGIHEKDSFRFQIEPEADRPSMTAMKLYGFDQIYQNASNSIFSLNGQERSSQSNNFTINKVFEVNLNQISPENEPVSIGFKNDIDAITENVKKLTDAFNQVVSTANKYDGTHRGTGKLSHEMDSILNYYGNRLEAIGISASDHGQLTIDNHLLADAITASDSESAFQTLGEFKNSLVAKANKMSLNPIDYIQKTVVAYKNPGRNFNSPYASSMYAGLMLDRQC